MGCKSRNQHMGLQALGVFIGTAPSCEPAIKALVTECTAPFADDSCNTVLRNLCASEKARRSHSF